MSESWSVLLVARTPELAERLARGLAAGGHHFTLARSFAEAKAFLESCPRPDLIVTELKLGAFNGLQLALRGRAERIPAIVVGSAGFEREAAQLGVAWLTDRDIDSETLLAVAVASISQAGERHVHLHEASRKVPVVANSRLS